MSREVIRWRGVEVTITAIHEDGTATIQVRSGQRHEVPLDHLVITRTPTRATEQAADHTGHVRDLALGEVWT